jgi:hypothetical protein
MPAIMALRSGLCASMPRGGSTLEPVDDDKFAVRLGFRQVRGLSNKDGAEIVAARTDRPFESVDDFWRQRRIAFLDPLYALSARCNARIEGLTIDFANLRGEKPADQPVQAPIKFELVINLANCEGAGPYATAVAARARRLGDRIGPLISAIGG